MFNDRFLDELTERAKWDPRLWKHFNLHESYSAPSQQFLNAIEPGSYIRPHRHFTAVKHETLVLIRGHFAIVIFQEEGKVEEIVRLSCETNKDCRVYQLKHTTWHSVLSLETGSILLDVKDGPYDPLIAKDFPSWAPAEEDPDQHKYLDNLRSIIK